MPESQWLVIGISGVTCGGKTTLSTLLHDFCVNQKCQPIPNTNYELGEVRLISQDSYFLTIDDQRHRWIKRLNHINWEILTALNMKQMLDDIATIIKDDCLVTDGQISYHQPNYPIRLNIMIIEGFLIFNQPEITQICQLMYHLHIPYEKCFARRKQRTYDPPDVVGYFEIAVWPMYEKHFAEFKDREDIVVLNADLPPPRLMKYILNAVQRFL